MKPAARVALLGAGVVAVGAAAWFGVPALARQLDFFRVRRVEVEGNRFVPAEQVAAALQLAPTANLFDPLPPLAERASAIEGVVEAELSRRPPGTIVVRLREQEPVALAPREGRLVMLGERAQALPYDPARTPADLPVIVAADPVVTALLARMHEQAPELFAELTSARRDGHDLVLDAAAGRWRLRADAAADEFLAVALVEEDLARRQQPWRELDVRFAGQVVVRREGA